MYQGNGIKTLVDTNGILWSIEKQIKERLDKKNCKWLKLNILRVIRSIDMN